MIIPPVMEQMLQATSRNVLENFRKKMQKIKAIAPIVKPIIESTWQAITQSGALNVLELASSFNPKL
uniref:Uncharacterized protein n=1 Tax=Arion vulgaris TaxID=1028688 RepID=A0A0B7A339_9EUPU